MLASLETDSNAISYKDYYYGIFDGNLIARVYIRDEVGEIAYDFVLNDGIMLGFNTYISFQYRIVDAE